MGEPINLPGAVHGTLQRRYLGGVTGLLLLCLGWFATSSALAQTENKQAQIAALNAEMNAAIQQVRKIVNQPVARLFRDSGMHVSTYSPGWFHAGANKPDFNHVDIRTTQEKTYDAHPYVTSDLNPGVVFRGQDLEFNGNTKYFYTDRSLPKKKLTEPEMLEINRLYRVIGHCEEQIALLQKPESRAEAPSASGLPSAPGSSSTVDAPATSDSFSTFSAVFKFVGDKGIFIVVLLLGGLYAFRK